MEKKPITKFGLNKLKAELQKLKNEDRPQIIQAISIAREHGDLSENAEYKSAKEKQSFIEGRLQDLEAIISSVEVIDESNFSPETIKFGANIKLLDLAHDQTVSYKIVGEHEADLDQGKISYLSPLARGLINLKLNDIAIIKAPSGEKEYEILEIYYKSES